MDWSDPKLFAVEHPDSLKPTFAEPDMPPWVWAYEGPPEPLHYNLTCGMVRDVNFKRFGLPGRCVCNDPPPPVYVHPRWFR